MITHSKIEIYTNAVNIRIDWATYKANVRSMKRPQVYCKWQQLINPQRKVKLVQLKEEGLTYIRHCECDVDNSTKCWVYFDARYMDPNLCYDKKTDSWFHYSTPGLFKNITNLRFEDNIKSWVPAQPHPHITIIWTNQNKAMKMTLRR